MDDKTLLLVLAGLGSIATGGWTLAAYCFRLVMRGDLVPRSTYQTAVDAAQVKDEAILTDLGQIKTTTVETGKSLHTFLESLQRVLRAPGLSEDGE